MIEINIKGKSYGSEQVLGNINLSIAPKSSIALLGPSGVGKSTFLRILSGLDNDFEGNIKNSSKTALVFQEPTLLPWRTTLQNITLISGASDETAIEVLDELGLASKLDHFPNQLSIGQQRRLSLARAFATKPKLLIMDEPFTSLDQSLVDEMLQLTKNLLNKRETTMLFVTHSMREAEFLSDDIYQLTGTPATLTKQ